MPNINLIRALPSLSTLLAIIAVTFSSGSMAENSLMEATQSTSSKTFDQISTLSLYSSLGKKHGETSYGGIQLATYKHKSSLERDSVVRIILGQTIEGFISPFFEVGTDFYGFLVLLSNNDKNRACKENGACAIDAFFRIGIRIELNRHNSLGIFHENIDFGDFHSNLVGEHSYTGASLGFKF